MSEVCVWLSVVFDVVCLVSVVCACVFGDLCVVFKGVCVRASVLFVCLCGVWYVCVCVVCVCLFGMCVFCV